MNRSPVAGVVLGVLVGALVIALHVMGILLPVEQAVVELIAGGRPVRQTVGPIGQGIIVMLLAITVCWLTITSRNHTRLMWPLGVVLVELAAVTWVCLLFSVLFQPVPSILAVLLGFGAAAGLAILLRPRRSTVVRGLFAGRLSQERLASITENSAAVENEARTHEVTAVVCDIANKHDLAEECAPAELARITEEFIGRAKESLLGAGAYIDTASGEGIVAIFGFPGSGDDHALTATKHALRLLKEFRDARSAGKGDAFARFDVHMGISSGTGIFAPVERDGAVQMLALGEPVELARRFCIANRFYGSSILIGPGTFEATSREVLARPIDFLSGVDVRERHEIYEPLKLAAEATAEEVGRRDFFWNGVVLYREKRWAEAYSQFQKARGPEDSLDAPLQLYLRRIEPLALHLAMAPDDE